MNDLHTHETKQHGTQNSHFTKKYLVLPTGRTTTNHNRWNARLVYVVENRLDFCL